MKCPCLKVSLYIYANQKRPTSEKSYFLGVLIPYQSKALLPSEHEELRDLGNHRIIRNGDNMRNCLAWLNIIQKLYSTSEESERKSFVMVDKSKAW
jgi:hypothetical protein